MKGDSQLKLTPDKTGIENKCRIININKNEKIMLETAGNFRTLKLLFRTLKILGKKLVIPESTARETLTLIKILPNVPNNFSANHEAIANAVSSAPATYPPPVCV